MLLLGAIFQVLLQSAENTLLTEIFYIILVCEISVMEREALLTCVQSLG